MAAGANEQNEQSSEVMFDLTTELKNKIAKFKISEATENRKVLLP